MAKAFSMVELIFVIIIIGILSSIAVPKFVATTKSAYQSRAESVVMALRSVIATERQKLILRGEAGTPVSADRAVELLSYGLDSNWAKDNSLGTFTYTTPGNSLAQCVFKINGGKLEIDDTDTECHSDTGLDHL